MIDFELSGPFERHHCYFSQAELFRLVAKAKNACARAWPSLLVGSRLGYLDTHNPLSAIPSRLIYLTDECQMTSSSHAPSRAFCSCPTCYLIPKVSVAKDDLRTTKAVGRSSRCRPPRTRGPTFLPKSPRFSTRG